MKRYDYEDFYIETDLSASGTIEKTTEKTDWIEKENVKYERLLSLPIEINVSCSGSYYFYFKYYKWTNQTNARHLYLAIKKTDGTWEKIKPEMNSARKTLKISLYGAKTICVFLNVDFYSIKTQNLANEFPIWTEARKNIYSNMQMLLNAFGREFERIEDFLKDVRRTKFIETLNENEWDWIYSYEMPNVTDIYSSVIKDKDGNQIELEEEIVNFFNKKNTKMIADEEKQKIYSLYNYGIISIEYEDKTFYSDFKLHQVWNSFDEMALLVGVKRRYLERNENLRERIFETFYFISNSSRQGLINAIARETNSINRKVWTDDNEDYYIYGLDINIKSIRVDGKKLKKTDIEVINKDCVMIKALKENKERKVKYITRIKAYGIDEEKELNKWIYGEDNKETKESIKERERIENLFPLKWKSSLFSKNIWKDEIRLLEIKGKFDESMDSFYNKKVKLNIWRDMEIWKSKNI